MIISFSRIVEVLRQDNHSNVPVYLQATSLYVALAAIQAKNIAESMLEFHAQNTIMNMQLGWQAYYRFLDNIQSENNVLVGVQVDSNVMSEFNEQFRSMMQPL